jgi:hypothetical protein
MLLLTLPQVDPLILHMCTCLYGSRLAHSAHTRRTYAQLVRWRAHLSFQPLHLLPETAQLLVLLLDPLLQLPRNASTGQDWCMQRGARPDGRLKPQLTSTSLVDLN